MDLVLTVAGVLTFLFMACLFLWSSATFVGGGLSLPSMFALTGLIYYYMMPIFGVSNSETGYFGLHIYSLDWMYIAVVLYAAGAWLAFFVNRNILRTNPAIARDDDRPYSWRLVLLIWTISFVGVGAMLALGYLNVFASNNFELAADVSSYAFLTLAFSMMVPMTLLFMLRNDFRPFTWVVMLVVMFLFIQAGFRYRMVVLVAASVTAFALTRNIKIRSVYVLMSIFVVLPVLNLIGSIRKYGNGIDLSGLENFSFSEFTTAFNGEIGIVYTLASFAQSPLPPPIFADPWIIALARLVPSFLWKNKPYPEYLKTITAGLADLSADQAGVAAPQQVEMLLQFGWPGLAILAFVYFSIICLLLRALNKLGWEGRIVGFSIIPTYFGFYMQTRGYFFQTLADGLFYFVPLFLIYFRVKNKKVSKLSQWS